MQHLREAKCDVCLPVCRTGGVDSRHGSSRRDLWAAATSFIAPIGSGEWRPSARATRLRRQVAVKLLRPEFGEDPEFVRRFEVEARHAASLSHPNVATVHDTDLDGDQRFIVMELIDGPSVADVIAQRGPPSRWWRSRSRPRLHARSRPRTVGGSSIVTSSPRTSSSGGRAGPFGRFRHRPSADLQPGHDARNRPRLYSVPISRAGPRRGGDCCRRHLLARRRPLRDAHRRPSVGGGHAGSDGHRPPPSPGRPPSEAVAGLPDGLDGIVGRALELDPGKRYPSARVLADALEGWSRRHRARGGGKAEIRHATTALAANVRSRASSRLRPVAAAGMPSSPAAAAGAALVAGAARPNPFALPAVPRGSTRHGSSAVEPLNRTPRPVEEATRDAPAAVARDGEDRRVGLLVAALALGLIVVVAAAFFVGGGSNPSQAPGAAVTSVAPATAASAASVAVPSVLAAPSATVIPLPTVQPPTSEPTPAATSPPATEPTPQPPKVSAPPPPSWRSMTRSRRTTGTPPLPSGRHQCRSATRRRTTSSTASVERPESTSPTCRR